MNRPTPTGSVRVPPGVLARCFWRSLFLQAAWNRRGMQNLGFAYAIDPALRAIYPDLGLRREALGRHLGFFNCHPYTAAAILGGAIHHEEKVAAEVELAGTPLAYKATLQGPLAAIGDGVFWTALRSMACEVEERHVIRIVRGVGAPIGRKGLECGPVGRHRRADDHQAPSRDDAAAGGESPRGRYPNGPD